MGHFLALLGERLRSAGVLGAILFACAYTPGAFFFIPSALFSFAAGYAYGPLYGTFVGVPGIGLSALTVFGLTRTVLRAPIEQWLGQDPRFIVVDRLLTRFGPKAVVLLRFSPVSPFSLLNFAFGLTAMKGWHYLLASLVGAVPGTLFYAQLGALAPQLSALSSGHLPEGGRTQTWFLAFGLCLTLGVALWLGRLARREMARVTAIAPSPRS